MVQLCPLAYAVPTTQLVVQAKSPPVQMVVPVQEGVGDETRLEIWYGSPPVERMVIVLVGLAAPTGMEPKLKVEAETLASGPTTPRAIDENSDVLPAGSVAVAEM